MNLNANPTKQQLAQLLSQCDDTAGHHVVWVKRSGDVEVSKVPRDGSDREFDHAHPEMQLRCETFLSGNEYVGPEAARDERWVTELFDALVREWGKARGKAEVAHVGRF